MGGFGTYRLAEGVSSVIVGDLVDVDLSAHAGTDFEPGTAEEAQACAHLATISFQPAGEAQAHNLAELVRDPVPVPADRLAPGSAGDGTPAAQEPAPSTPAPAGDGVAAAQAELDKAQADLAAAEAATVPPAA